MQTFHPQWWVATYTTIITIPLNNKKNSVVLYVEGAFCFAGNNNVDNYIKISIDSIKKSKTKNQNENYKIPVF